MKPGSAAPVETRSRKASLKLETPRVSLKLWLRSNRLQGSTAPDDPLRKLHGGAVERPVLDDEGCAVNTYNLVGGEGFLDDGLGGTVLLGLVVRGV